MFPQFGDPKGDLSREVAKYKRLHHMGHMSMGQAKKETLEKAQQCLDDLNQLCSERGETDYTQAKRAYYKAFLAAGRA